MRHITDVAIDKIASNPYRRLHTYPYIERKLEALERSIQDVGLWPSIIARIIPHEGLWTHEIAFGHHRLEAARRNGLDKVPLIVERLTDKEMLQYMGRENLEDYNAAFLIQLEGWEAAIKSGLLFVKSKSPQAIDVARLLGWTRHHDASNGETLNATAAACNAAFALIQAGHMAREDFADLTVEAARNIAERTWSRIQQIEKVGAGSARPHREIEAAKEQYGRAAGDVAKQVRAGIVTNRDIRGRVDVSAAGRAAQSQRPSPLFAVFANAVADNLRRTLQTDSDAEKLSEIERVLPQLSLLEDWEALRRLDVELLNLAKRAEGWQKRLIPPQEKIRHFKALEGGNGGTSRAD